MIIAIVLFIIGLACGSFVNALVWRLHQQNKAKSQKPKTKNYTENLSIINGRSICPNCKHQLAWLDLIPIISWLSLGGKCRYCKKPISKQYPLIELAAGLIFSLSYIFWPFSLELGGQIILLTTWLVVSIGLLALAVYDFKWMLLPNRIVYPTLFAAITGRIAYIALYEDSVGHALFLWMFSLLISSGIFFALFSFSKGKWIGYGDVRLGLITGTVLAEPQLSLMMIFIASLIGSIIAAPSLLSGKKTMGSKLPYGPFLITATAIVVLFGTSMLDWYKDLIL